MMKTLNKLWGMGLLSLLLLLAAPIHSKAQQGEYISDQEFYDELEPDGTWISDPQYGNVWVPDAEEGFRPYATRGHWVLTEYGNTWVSDYRWGWATFHYGRWRYDDYYGWEWIPGHEWAPAWVSWRHGGGYYGWAPLMPGISISLSIGGGYRAPDNYWVCAPETYINRPNIYNYYMPHSRAVTIIRNTTIINNTYVNNNVTYIAGPRAEDIRRATHQNVQVYRVNNASRPGNEIVRNNAVNIYRPAVTKAPDAHPTRIVDGNAYRQQHPDQAIADRRTGGAPAFNHANAARLAQVARDPRPDNKVVRVNPAPNRPAQQAARPGQVPTRPNQPLNRQPVAGNPAQAQPQQREAQRAQQQQGQVRSQRPQPQQVQPQQVQPQQRGVQLAQARQRGVQQAQPQAQQAQQRQAERAQAQQRQAQQAQAQQRQAQQAQAQQRQAQQAQAQQRQAQQAQQRQAQQQRQQPQRQQPQQQQPQRQQPQQHPQQHPQPRKEQ